MTSILQSEVVKELLRLRKKITAFPDKLENEIAKIRNMK